MADIVSARETERMKQLEEAGWVKQRGLVHGENDCLADSLLQLLSHIGILPHLDSTAREVACKLNRLNLRVHPDLEENHRPQGNEFLQENIHSEPTILFFMQHFRSQVVAPLPSSGIILFVHSVWCGNGMIPPAETRVCANPEIADRPLEMHLYNVCHGGLSGLHFDPLFHS